MITSENQVMTIRIFVFWQNFLSIHQSSFIRALADQKGVRVIVAYEQDIPPERRSLGWDEPDFGEAELVDVRVPKAMERLVQMNDQSVCHAFGTFFNLPVSQKAFHRLKGSASRRVWITEAFDHRGWRGIARRLRYGVLVRRVAVPDIHFVFAMGRLGVHWFCRAGFPAERVQEFGYLSQEGYSAATTPVGQVEPLDIDHSPQKIRFLFVGQLVHRKGLDVLLKALASLDVSPRDAASEWQLDIIGDGSLRQELLTTAGNLGLDMSRVRFLGAMSNQAVQVWMRKADWLVLPSRFDGWGTVVNEALLAGARTIASDACGASALLNSQLFGATFISEDSKSLSLAFIAALESGRLSKSTREKIAHQAQKALSPESLAIYFQSVVDWKPSTVRLKPPWQETGRG